MGRKVMELHGGESERLVGVSTSCWSVCRTIGRRGAAAGQRGKRGFMGSIVQTTMNQKEENWSDSLWRKRAGTQG